MRVTFHPDGTFIKVWELFRIIIAASSCILFPVHIILISTGYNIFWYIKFMLDGMAYLDLYIRLHSCYYNEKGLLITHPLKTAAHYLKNGFLIDFLGCVPLELFFIRSNVYQYNVRSYIVYNRLLQFLRIMSGISYANQNVKTPWFYQFVKYIPLLFIVINFMGTLLVKQYCDFHPSIPASENFTAGVTCPGKNWITTSDYAKNERPLTPLKVYLLGIYFAISLITTQGLPGIKAQNLNDCLVFSIFAFLEEMKSLNHFMQKRQIPFDVRKYTIDYFETFWLSKRGTTSHGLLDSFHSSLKFDALYNVYSSSINLHCVLSGATNRSFYHTILNLAVPEFYVKKVSICQVNDITDKFYILHKGRVEVKAVNGNRLVVLTAGAIFGNIKYSSQSRITVNFYPMGQVEVLVFSTMQFYKIIECYPIMKRRFAHITKLHTDFIPPNPIGQFEDLDKIRYTNTSKSASFASSLFQIKLIQPDAFYYKIWEVWTLIIGCYITFVFVIYQFCVQDGKIVLFCIGYFFDLCYAIRPYLKLRLPFENEVGEMVTRKALIRRRYFHSKLGLLLDIITIPPIELIAVFFTHKWLFYCTLLRLNRLPRILVIYDFFEARKNKLNIHSTMKKNKMSAFMTIRIWYYVCLLWDHQRGHQYPKLLMNAPNHLREKVNMCIYEKYLKQCYIFSSCEDDLVRQMVGKMKELTFFPGNYITYEGDIDESMYFILEGKIYVVLEGKDTNTTLKTLHENDVFGLVQGLHSEIPHAFTYIAKTRTVIIVLKRTNWEYLLDFFPASRQSLLQRADLLLKKESEDFGYY
ncbi:hypothetical protein C0J52_12942 [Blattella germanica]|nr:hypothetical protein C0J52_12942 [Blattella germanica]